MRTGPQHIHAITAALRSGARHTPECAKAGESAAREHRPAPSRPGCPWCDAIATDLDDEREDSGLC